MFKLYKYLHIYVYYLRLHLIIFVIRESFIRLILLLPRQCQVTAINYTSFIIILLKMIFFRLSDHIYITHSWNFLFNRKVFFFY